jgi:serine/threonine-protein kinase HSL1 (negative regulator of Swe1 kinase)
MNSDGKSYLVLEYVDDGELFDHISSKGRLPEEESLKYFRQVLSAIGYCHSFNICHRDLKPENILLNREGNVKIADFGMAALQQNPDHRLQTSCGSPHYAAPEVIRPGPYKGDKVDIWSMGIILFATLAGYLPFDHPNLTCLLATVQKGRYDMPPNLSPEASDLIYRMLQVNPRDRINISQIWRHPLLRKYDYLDNFGKAPNPQQPDFRNAGRPVLRRSEIDRELLRHLRSMWHTLEESQIIKLLLNEEYVLYAVSYLDRGTNYSQT